jgi:hypothetical protein
LQWIRFAGRREIRRPDCKTWAGLQEGEAGMAFWSGKDQWKALYTAAVLLSVVVPVALTSSGLCKSVQKKVAAPERLPDGRVERCPPGLKMVPLTTGTSWTYELKHTSQEGGAINNVFECSVTEAVHKQTVVDSISGARLSGALIEDRTLKESHAVEKHNLDDGKLMGSVSQPSTESPVRYLLRLVFDNSRYYELAEDDRPVTGQSLTLDAVYGKGKQEATPYSALRYWLDLKKKVVAGKKVVEPVEDDLRMKFPAGVGSTWLREDNLKDCNGKPIPPRHDTWYCWCVEEIGPAKLPGAVARSFPSAKARQYSLAYRTNPDHTLHNFVPGIGVMNYEYRHHGTVEDASDTLIDFQSGGRQSPDPELKSAIDRYKQRVRALPAVQ